MNTLIVVDMQNDFINIDGKLPVKGAFEALFNIYALIESNEIDKVIFTADWHVPSHESFKLNGIKAIIDIYDKATEELTLFDFNKIQ